MIRFLFIFVAIVLLPFSAAARVFDAIQLEILDA